MKNQMFEKVNVLLEKYVGGQIFFTELDKAVKFNQEILEELVDKAENFHNCLTIASGEIGLSMHNLGVKVDFLVPGGLRHDPTKINLEPFADRIEGQDFIFVDDSYFSGKTAMVVKEEIERLGGRFVGSLVAYDGSKYKEENVWSLYRYYDYHDLLGRPLK
jgi:hypothetical protein